MAAYAALPLGAVGVGKALEKMGGSANPDEVRLRERRAETKNIREVTARVVDKKIRKDSSVAVLAPPQSINLKSGSVKTPGMYIPSSETVVFQAILETADGTTLVARVMSAQEYEALQVGQEVRASVEERPVGDPRVRILGPAVSEAAEAVNSPLEGRGA